MNFNNIIQRWADIQPSKLAVSFIKFGNTYSYLALEKKTAAICKALNKIGLGEGEVIAISFKEAEKTALYLISLIRMGALPLCIDPSLAGESTLELIKFAEPKCILLSSDDRRAEGIIGKDLNFCQTVLEGTKKEIALLSSSHKKKQAYGASILLPTSGTTGKPKIVQISSRAFITNAKDICNFLGITEKDRFLSLTPLSYCHGFYNGILMPLVNGAGTVVIEKFDAFTAAKFWKIIEEHSVSVVNIVPTMIEMLLRINYTKFVKPPSLRFSICGTARLRESQKRIFEERFKTRIYTQYGMTESLINTVNKVSDKPDSPGVPVGCSIVIRDTDGRPMSAGKVGEITISGDSVTCGYFKNTGLTVSVIEKKHLKSGDIGYLDDDGYLYVIGRAKEIVNKGGVKIYPEEVSDIFRKHPFVSDVCTVGINDGVYGEDLLTFLVVKKDEKVTIQQMFSFAKSSLPTNKIPREIFLVDSIPRGPTGKPKLEELKQRAKRGVNVQGR